MVRRLAAPSAALLRAFGELGRAVESRGACLSVRVSDRTLSVCCRWRYFIGPLHMLSLAKQYTLLRL
jgi:hypothetical protein